MLMNCKGGQAFSHHFQVKDRPPSGGADRLVRLGDLEMASRCFRLEDFELDCSSCRLCCRDTAVRLQRLPLELLILLVERRGELVTREEIIQRSRGKDTFFDAA